MAELPPGSYTMKLVNVKKQTTRKERLVVATAEVLYGAHDGETIKLVVSRRKRKKK